MSGCWIRLRSEWVCFKLCVCVVLSGCVSHCAQVMALSDQVTQFQERLLDQTEEVHRTNAQLELMRRERDTMNAGHSDQIRQLVNERTQLQVVLLTHSLSLLSHLAEFTTLSLATTAQFFRGKFSHVKCGALCQVP